MSFCESKIFHNDRAHFVDESLKPPDVSIREFVMEFSAQKLIETVFSFIYLRMKSMFFGFSF